MAFPGYSLIKNFLGLFAAVRYGFLGLAWIRLIHKFFEHVHTQSSLHNKIKSDCAIFIKRYIVNTI